MFGIVKNIRGLAQSVVRGAVSIGMAIGETYETLKASGLGYLESQFTFDYEQYDIQADLTTQIADLDSGYIIPTGLHAETDRDLTCKFMYDLSCIWENEEGETEEQFWSVISEQRLSTDEILEDAEGFPAEYGPEAFPFHGPIKIIASWTRK